MDIHEFMQKYKTGYDILKSKFDIFQYFNFERNIVDALEKNSYNILLHGRQMHITTILRVYSQFHAIKGKKIYYISNRIESSNKFIDNILHFNKDEILKCSKRKIDFKSGGTIKVMSSRLNELFLSEINNNDIKDVIIIIDNAAFISNLSNLINYFNGLNINKIIVASSPNGLNDFFKLFVSSSTGKSPFKLTKVTYKDNPRYDEKWAKEMLHLLGYNSFRQEILVEFFNSETKNNEITLQVRVNEEIMGKIREKLLHDNINISTYLRDLIIKDVNK